MGGSAAPTPEGGADSQNAALEGRARRRVALGLFATLLAMAATCVAIRSPLRAVDLAPSSELAIKLDWLAHAEHSFDVMFVGSSYTYHGLDPRVVDGELTKRKLPMRSYNLAAAGTYGFEIYHYVRALLELPAGKRPRLAVLELYPLTPRYVMTVMEGNRLNDRMIEYHDPWTTWENLRALYASDYSWMEKGSAALSHALHFGYRFGNVGALGAVLEEPPKPRQSRARLDARRGFAGEHHGARAFLKGFDKAEYGERLQAYSQRVRDCERDRSSCGDDLAAEWQFRLSTRDLLVRHGIGVAFLVPPVPYGPTLPYRRLCARADSPPCIVLNSPDEHPALYETRNRFDRGHLNDRGSVHMSRAVAAGLDALVRSGKLAIERSAP